MASLLPTHVTFVVIIVMLIAASSANAFVNFHTCLEEVRSGAWGTIGGTDNRGRPISDISKATAITYNLCITACGKGSERFRWDTFSQQFGSWLLPWLALVSQLPFGTHSILQNLLSVLLTIGSPTLAAYSLAVTVLNGHWVARRFSHIRNPNSCNAVRALSSLQQSPLIVTKDTHLLASLLVLPENETWWDELVAGLEYTHTWSISAGTSVVWVIVAYVFTVIDSLQGDITQSISAHGQGIGSLWLWLLPVVTGWLQLSPKCDSKQLYRAIQQANARAYTVMEDSELVLVKDLPDAEHAFSLATPKYDIVHCDELCTAPIYNYARFLPWARSVETVARTFEALETPPDDSEKGELRASAAESIPVSRWGRSVWLRFLVASFFALLLQWGTTGAAMMVNYFTPTFGIGCRVASYLLYGCVGTFSWMLLMTSTFLCHYSTTTFRPSRSSRVARRLSIALRIIGKTFACLNAFWVIMACIFQFGNFYDRCWCNSSVIGLGEKAYNVIEIIWDEVHPMRVCWIIGVAVAAGSAFIYALFVNVFINPRLPN
ncbi:hypothetical protein DXG01_011560 [Tephrocybe rancida]|nr:hypothetical protein DXG01_011560 [Tephrocybe rancida]